MITIHRPVYTQEEFDVKFGRMFVDLSLCGRFRSHMHTVLKHKLQFLATFLFNCFPPLAWLPSYDLKSKFLPDLTAGVTVGIMSVPQGMAYGILAGVPPVYGLYTAFFAPILYSTFGTSRHINFGPFAIISLMVAGVLNRISSCNESCTLLSSSNGTFGKIDIWFCDCAKATNCTSSEGVSVEVASALTLLVGLFQIGLGLLNMGFLAVYLSEQLVEGLTTAAGLFVLTSQIGNLLGLSHLPKTGRPLDIIWFYGCLTMRIMESSYLPILISFACILILVFNKLYLSPFTKRKLKFPMPMDLILMVFFTVLSNCMNLKDNFGLRVIGDIPRGMQAPRLPKLRLLADVIPDALAIAIVSYSMSISIAKLFSLKHSYRIKANHEWFAYGFVHSVSAFFLCICSGASLTKTLIQDQQGGSTQISSLISAFIVLVTLLALAPLLRSLPTCVLSAIIVVALEETFRKFGHLRKLWKLSKTDFWIWVVSFLAVTFLDVTYGLVVSVVFALLTVVVRSQWPDRICLGVIPGTELYRGINAYEQTQEFPGIKIFRFDSPLYFANAEMFKKCLYESTGVDPISVYRVLKKSNACRVIYSAEEEISVTENYTARSVSSKGLQERGGLHEPLQQDSGLHTIIIDCSSFSYIDLAAVNALFHVYQEYQAIGIKVFFAQCKVAVRQMLQNSCFYLIVPNSAVYMSIHDAVVAATAKTTSPVMDG